MYGSARAAWYRRWTCVLAFFSAGDGVPLVYEVSTLLMCGVLFLLFLFLNECVV